MSISESEQFHLLDQLAEEFADRFRRGERPALKEYTDRYPELADAIRELFPTLVKVEQAEGVLHGDEQIGNSRAAHSQFSEIGDYRILCEIGRGGMGVVYEAEQISLGRRVALKVLPAQVSSDRLVQERFRREARAAARLHHTNIVPVFEVGHDRGVRFYAMQFIQGQGLDTVIAELRRLRDLAWPESKTIAASRGQALRGGPEPSSQGIEPATLGDDVEVSAVLQYVLTGRLEPGDPDPAAAGALEPTPARARSRGEAPPSRAGTATTADESDPALVLTEAEGAKAGDNSGAQRAHPPRRPRHHLHLRRQARPFCPGVRNSRGSSRTATRRSAVWPRSAGRSPAAWPMRTRAGSCTGTSSRRTCSWTPKAWSGSPISAWPRAMTRG